MTYRTTLILSAILLVILAAVYWFTEPAVTTAINNRQGEIIDQDADYFLTNALIKEYELTGSLKYQLVSDSITHYPYNDHTLLQMPVLKNQGDSGQITTSRSDNGKLLPGGNDVELWDNVVVIQDNASSTPATENDQSNSRVRMDTDFVTISMKEEVADTHRPVLITTDSGETRATGMTAYFQQGQTHLKSRVRGTYEPE